MRLRLSPPCGDRFLSALALAASGIALFVTGHITLQDASAGERLLLLTTASESDMHGQLMRVERTLRRMVWADPVAGYPESVSHPSRFAPGLRLADSALTLERKGLLDLAIRLDSSALYAYDGVLADDNYARESLALGRDLRGWATYSIGRIAQKRVAQASFRIQSRTAAVSMVLGVVLFVIGALASGVQMRIKIWCAREAPSGVQQPSSETPAPQQPESDEPKGADTGDAP
jgi:hypothetical protein